MGKTLNDVFKSILSSFSTYSFKSSFSDIDFLTTISRMLVDAGIGRGGAYDRVCTGRSPLGRMDANTFHSHGRFGTYMLNGNFPKHLDTSTVNNGYFSDKKTCDAFTQAGEDRGLSSALVNHFDYGNAFVGHYNGGE